MRTSLVRRATRVVAPVVGIAVLASILTVAPAPGADAAGAGAPEVQEVKSVPVSEVKAKAQQKKSFGEALKFSASHLPKRDDGVEAPLDGEWTDPAGGMSVRSRHGKDKSKIKDLAVTVTPLGHTAKSGATGAGPVFEISTEDADTKQETPASLPTTEPEATPESQVTPSAEAAKKGKPAQAETTAGPGAEEVVPPSLEVKLDYSDFADAFGGDWAGRLRLVKLDDCEDVKGTVDCSGAEPLKTEHDFTSQTLTASIPASQTQRSMTLAATAAPSSSQGDFTATPMTPSSTWAAGNQSGDFTWSYPLEAPPSLGGPAPDLAISYSSGAVDGKSSATNGQTSWIGEGFSLDPGFVERSYEPCRQVREGDSSSNAPSDVGDLCWRDDNLTISLNGTASELVRVGSTDQWRMKSDDGTRVEQVTTAGINDDNNGEHWKVTTADGTQYYYGRNERFDGDTHKTNSVSTVPVYGSRSGEPCHDTSYASSVCDQGWRWGLDYVVDPHGNTMSLFYTQETNNYGSNKNATVRDYDRASVLTSIEYGTRAGTENDSPAPAKVQFTTAERCISDSFDCTSALTEATASHWPEIPFDQICTSSSSCADRVSPTFFSRKRLDKVSTFVAGSAGYDPVNEWKLTQDLPATGDISTDPDLDEPSVRTLWLAKIQQTGKAGTDVTLPPVTFTAVNMFNRVYDTNGVDSFSRFRVSAIANGTGGSIAVKYSGRDCTESSKPSVSALDTNARRCFPVWFQPDWTTTRHIEFFHKYRVDSVTETDNTGGALTKVTNYAYSGGDGWHYDNSSLERPKYRTWNQWRGYQSVTTEVGQTAKTYSNTLYLRGMHGDKKQAGGTKVVNVTDPVSGGATSIQDDDQLAGFERRTVTKLGSAGAVVDIAVNTPWTSTATATQGSAKAYIVRTGKTEVKTWLPATSTYRTTSVSTTFNARGQADTVLDSGNTAIATDDRCTKHTYATNTTKGMYDYPATEITTAGTCTATIGSADDVLSATRTSYDGGVVGAAPTKGDATTAESALGWAAGTGIAYQADAIATYDSYGRTTSVKDAKGQTTTAAYSPATGPVDQITTTNALGQAATVALNAVGSPTRSTDAAGAKTDYAYDGLGRVASIWAPGRDKATESASVKYSYRVSATQANAVTTETLNNAGDYVTSVAFYDGLLRERSTQTLSPGAAGGRVITDKIYDDHGWVKSAGGPYFNSYPVDTTLVGASENTIDRYFVYTYDLAGRVTKESLASHGAVKYSTITAYGGDRVAVTPPTGGTATTTVTDARGQTTGLSQHLAATPTGTADTTTYGYSKRGELAKITDPSGSVWNKTYNIRGQLISDSDPDKGLTTFSYDSLGQQVTSTDARGVTLWTGHDKLGRKTELRDDNATGLLRSSWIYDTVRPGSLTSSTRFADGQAYTSEVTAYDTKGQPTSSRVVIPASEGLLAGNYVTGSEYNVDGTVKKLTQPAIDDPTAEALTYTYDALGNPKKLTGFTTLVTNTTYSSLGHMTQRTLGTTVGKVVYDTREHDLATNDVKRRQVGLQGTATAPITDLRYTYDNAGNVKKLNDVAAGDTAQTSTSTWRQCFNYDYLRRMTAAYTSSGNTCAAPTTANLGAVAPFWDAYTFSKSGNRTKVISVRKPAAALVTTTHTSTFPAATAARPHAVASTAKTGGSTGTESFTYDATGNLSKRSTSAAAGKTIVFGREGHEKTVTDIATGKITEYLYDADGNRLIERNAADASTTLFLASGEVTSKAGTRSTVRTYTISGEPVATRDSSGVKLMANDRQGTPLIRINATNQAFGKRRYSPYGELLQAPATWPSNRGYLNKTTDKTGTTHLDAREYDAAAGRFISVDPIMDPMDPQQMNGYAYANNSPVSNSDPSGLYQTVGGAGQMGPGYYRPMKSNGFYDFEPRRIAANPAGGAYSAGLFKPLRFGGPKDVLASAASVVTGAADLVANGAQGRLPFVSSNYNPYTTKFMYDKLGIKDDSVLGILTDVAFILASGGESSVAKAPSLTKTTVEVSSDAANTAAKACSFAGATVVLMADGSKKPIEDIKVGDKVIATDPETGEQEPKTVEHVFVHDDTLTDLVLADGTVLTTTEDHPYWSADDGRFERADELAQGERVLGADGKPVEVAGLRLATARDGLAYNLSVDGIHTYHVGDDEILVHNSCFSALDALKSPKSLEGLTPTQIDDLARNAGLDVLPGKAGATNPASRYYMPGTNGSEGFRVLPRGVPGQTGVKSGPYLKFFGGPLNKTYVPLAAP